MERRLRPKWPYESPKTTNSINVDEGRWDIAITICVQDEIYNAKFNDNCYCYYDGTANNLKYEKYIHKVKITGKRASNLFEQNYYYVYVGGQVDCTFIIAE